MKFITKKWLEQMGACKKGISFFEINNLERFPIELLKQVNGEYEGFVKWIKDKLRNYYEYDSNGNVIYSKNSNGNEYWKEYDSSRL